MLAARNLTRYRNVTSILKDNSNTNLASCCNVKFIKPKSNMNEDIHLDINVYCNKEVSSHSYLYRSNNVEHY